MDSILQCSTVLYDKLVACILYACILLISRHYSTRRKGQFRINKVLRIDKKLEFLVHFVTAEV